MTLNLRGIIPPMITPLTEDYKLDETGLKVLIEHLISGGVHGIFLLGSNGEGPSLSNTIRKELITKACEYIDKRVPVLVGITDTSFDGSIEIAEHSKTAGADAVVIAPPYYFPISDAEMDEYLNTLIPKLPLPFLLYNMPSCTKMNLSLETVKKGKELGALGVKDSSGNLDYLNSLIDAFSDSPEFAVIAGAEGFLPATIERGGHGAVAGGANIFPRLFVDLYDAALAKEEDKIVELLKKVNHINDTIYSVGKTPSRITKGIKCGVSVLGICDDYMAMPLHRFGAVERDKVKCHIENFKKESMAEL
ncbi:dihydrodipicolinate synthase family protein [Aurantibacter crassamenti]|uniref:dihydrodipicolinate synthase family protein n=1 Tax=Aurantibacter crassamenti TaxID=1837375 RepID=UPI0019393433|nr:dihydrodipicolinate synthase family protein [Aurantibacter crassamenti]MBM1105113.1 dihydrodipicolinate synthase family protein [Aurantibacter crassamenti]